MMVLLKLVEFIPAKSYQLPYEAVSLCSNSCILAPLCKHLKSRCEPFLVRKYYFRMHQRTEFYIDCVLFIHFFLCKVNKQKYQIFKQVHLDQQFSMHLQDLSNQEFSLKVVNVWTRRRFLEFSRKDQVYRFTQLKDFFTPICSSVTFQTMAVGSASNFISLVTFCIDQVILMSLDS